MLCGQIATRPTVSDTLALLNGSSITAVKSGSPQNVCIINDLALCRRILLLRHRGSFGVQLAASMCRIVPLADG